MDKFDLTQAEPTGFDLTTEVNPPAIPETLKKRKAIQYHVALGENSPGTDVLESDISLGNDEGVRRSASIQEEMKLRKAKMEFLGEIAKSQDGPLTREQTDFVMGLGSSALMQNNLRPEQIMEKLYSERFMDFAVTDNPVIAAADPQELTGFAAAMEDVLFKQELIKTTLYDKSESAGNMPMADKVWNTVEQFFPFVSAAHRMASDQPSWLLDENIRQQADAFWSMPRAEAEAWFKARYAEIEAGNPYDALLFAQNMLGYSASEGLLDRVYQASEYISAGTGITARTLGKAALKVGRKAVTPRPNVPTTMAENLRAQEALKGVVKANVEPDAQAPDILAEAGKIEDAATTLAVKSLAAEVRPQTIADEAKALAQKVPSLWDPGVFLQRSGKYSREQARRIEDYLTKSGGQLLESLSNPSMALRLTQEALTQAVLQTKEKLRRLYPNANSAIVDTEWRVLTQDAEGNLARSNEVSMTLGTPEALPFESEDQARVTAELLYGISDQEYSIRPTSGGYYLSITRPIDETDTSVRALLTESSYNKTPGGVFNTLIGFIRSPEDTVSKFQRDNRHASTHVAQEIHDYFRAAASQMERLSKRQKDRLTRLMEANREHVEGDKRGRFYQDVEEFSTTYEREFGQYPTVEETAAYFTTRQLNDIDWMVRNLSIYRDKSRLGVTRVDFSVLDKQGNRANIVTEGISRDDVPWDGDADVFIPDINMYFRTKDVTPEQRAQTEQMLKEQGYRVVELHNPNERPLMEVTEIDDTINYVVTRDARYSKLNWEQLPYRPGYHVEYAPGYFVKQPMLVWSKTNRKRYVGDTSILYFKTEAQAKKYASALEEFRVLFKDKKFDEAKAFAAKNLPHTWEDLSKRFNSSINQNVKITYTRSGQNVIDNPEHSELFRGVENTLDDPFNTYAIVNKKYASEKDLALPTVLEGTEGRPVLSPATYAGNYIDPITTLHRATAGIIRNRAYDDYQIAAVESWLSEFGPYLRGQRAKDRAYRNPMAVIHSPEYEPGTAPEIKAMAENSRKAITLLLGRQSELDGKLNLVINKALDGVYNKFGQAPAEYINNKLLNVRKDPFAYIRSLAFHTKMGLFNPVQFFLQGQTILHGAAITGNPGRAMSATAGAWMMRALNLTDDFDNIEAMASRASKLGWNHDEFLESYLELKKTGYWKVEGENAWKDDVMTPTLFTGRGGRFLDKGLIFFREGERLTRLSAWNIAFKEFKKANPGKKINTAERNAILRRADDLSVNMTRASMAAWQKGILSLPAQFNGYTVRLMEQMLGKRLTKMEKARVLGLYSTLYGIPAGLVTAFPLVNFGQDIKAEGLRRGIDINDGMTEVLLNGIVAAGVEGLFGAELAISERYAPNQLPILNSIARGDSTWAEIVLGPSGGVLHDFLKTTAPVVYEMAKVWNTDGEIIVPELEDVSGALAQVSSINQIRKMIYATNLGANYSKNGILLDRNVDGTEGFFMGVFGVDPRELNDSFIKRRLNEEWVSAQKEAGNQAVLNFRKSMKAEDWDTRDSYLKKFSAWIRMGNFRPDQLPGLFTRSFDGDSTIEEINQRWLKNGPIDKLEARQEQYLKDLKKNGKVQP